MRALVQESHLLPSDFVIPLFVVEGVKQKQVIPGFPGVFRFSRDLLIKEAERLHAQGILAIALFPMVERALKDEKGSEAISQDNLMARAIADLKRELPDLLVIADVALDPYTTHGHDGIVNAQGEVLNDETVEQLVHMALVLAQVGVDIVAPSDMMDGRIGAIRKGLDGAGYAHVGILSYAAKYASALYGPFRSAVQSTLQFGDKRGYQLNPGNRREALLEGKLDEEEGADMLLVKPALFYLDVIAALKKETHIPVGAYLVSGEYAMVMAAHEQGHLDGPSVLHEALLAIKRAGADFIVTYALPQLAQNFPTLYTHRA